MNSGKTHTPGPFQPSLNPVAKEAAGAYFGDPAMSTSKALPLFIGDPAKTGAIRFNHRSTDPANKAAAKAAFYADVSDDQFAAVANLRTPDEPAAVFGAKATVTAARWVGCRGPAFAAPGIRPFRSPRRISSSPKPMR